MDVIKEEFGLLEGTTQISSVKEEKILDIKYEVSELKVSGSRV
jgi:hypothetical protein